MRYFLKPQRSLALLVATVLLAASAWAQPQPQAKTVRMLIAFPPGGPVDFVGRALAEGMAKELGQPVMVEKQGRRQRRGGGRGSHSRARRWKHRLAHQRGGGGHQSSAL